ncbi:NAD(P)-binding protein [Dendrothele bispora CBS 962.96]|uniref:NAD(P)-binding protein n=1 Tax=Dendrothele bispora (strain CBS 962.96) TaxID=1314807 RepID=A0A4S8LCC6_DENBC|nr:NAD(P)-binding protein [Dendrothele bispora CBS 962.96]
MFSQVVIQSVRLRQYSLSIGFAATGRRAFSASKIASRNAIVTGAGQGIGRAIALRLAQDGFDVCVNDLESNASCVTSLVNEIQAMGREAVIAYANVAKRSEVETVVDKSVDKLGPLSLMVANAGIAKVQWMMESTEEDWRRIFDVNVFGVVNCNIAAAKQFVRQGTGGKILNAASGTSFRPSTLIAPYSATKASVRSITQAFAMELAKHNITVNAYAPGIVDSPMWEQIDEGLSKINGLPKGENFRRSGTSLITLGRTSVPEDVSKAVSFLAGPDSDYMTGQTVACDGGIIFT